MTISGLIRLDGVFIQVFRLARKEPLGLPANASVVAMKARLRALGLKEHVKKGRPGEFHDPDWNNDLMDLKTRSGNPTGHPNKLHVKIDTLVVVVGSDDDVIGWSYEMD